MAVSPKRRRSIERYKRRQRAIRENGALPSVDVRADVRVGVRATGWYVIRGSKVRRVR